MYWVIAHQAQLPPAGKDGPCGGIQSGYMKLHLYA
jgi:hypothetical protein